MRGNDSSPNKQQARRLITSFMFIFWFFGLKNIHRREKKWRRSAYKNIKSSTFFQGHGKLKDKVAAVVIQKHAMSAGIFIRFRNAWLFAFITAFQPTKYLYISLQQNVNIVQPDILLGGSEYRK